MTSKWLLAVSTAAIFLAGCESGDINVAPSTNVNNPPPAGGGNGGGNDNPCAFYANTAGQTVSGSYDGTHCTYAPSFVDAGNNLAVDLTIPALPNDGAHIFQGSLFVGETYDTDAEMQAAGIAQGGDGPTLTIEPGVTIAFPSERQFVVINRGSQIFAQGTPDAPITFTSLSDVQGTVGPEDVQQWGGIVINGFGVTNACEYTGSVAGGDLALAGECHVQSEGSGGADENHYGGANNDDNSGALEYVVVKHTGATVGNGDELNGITFAGVGRGTVVRNIQVYSVYDDGIEMFGGSFDVENYVALYVRDDSLDFDEGYTGTIRNALIIQSQNDGNTCVEADGIADYGNLDPAAVQAVIDQGINSRVVIDRMTCIFSPNGTGTHEPGMGLRLREGLFVDINDSLVIGSFAANDTTANNDNVCLRIDNRSQQAALDGDLNLNRVIFACAERTRAQTFPDGTSTEESFAVAEGNVFATVADGTPVNPTAAADADLQLLEGAQPFYSITWASSLVDGAAPAASTDPADAQRPYLGAISLSDDDWTQPWTYGLHPDNRAQALWIEAP